MSVFPGYKDGFLAGYRDHIRSDLETQYFGVRWNRGYRDGQLAAIKDLKVRERFTPSGEMETRYAADQPQDPTPTYEREEK